MPLPAKPNVLVFFCDQMRRDALGCYGNGIVRTPHLDALADGSTVFDRAYTPTPLCSPARASLMSGLYPHAHHMFNNSTKRYSYCQYARPDLRMLGHWAAERGEYETAYFGKWHIGPAEDLAASGFEQTMHAGHPSFSAAQMAVSFASGYGGAADVPLDEFPDVRVANRCVEFLRRRKGDRPFLLFCALPGPHPPWIVPKAFGLRHRPEDMRLWPNCHDPMEGKPLYQRKLRLLGGAESRWPDGPDRDRRLRELLACSNTYVELVDEMAGRVLAEIARQELDGSTVVLFTADHGSMDGAHGMLSKGGYLYEETCRIPMLARIPGQAPQRLAQPVHLMDVTATVLHAMAGEKVADMGSGALHGESLLPLAERGEWARRYHYAEYHGDWYGHYSSRMVTDGEWKLVWNFTDWCELYDLANDPWEMENRFRDPACREKRDELFGAIIQEARRLEDGQTLKHNPAVEMMV